MSEIFDSIQVPDEVKRLINHSFDVVDQIHEVLESQGKSQKDLADALGKKESEVSKWMRGTHNFTLKSIAKIEAALGESIITTPIKARKLSQTKMVIVSATVNKRVHFEAQEAVVWTPNAVISETFNNGLKSA